jgi:outer membrane protein with beta-barrel domain
MKKVFLSALTVILVNMAFAQHVEFGLKGGVNFANLKDDANSNTDARTGFNAGALAHIHLSKTFAIQPEVVYSVQGAEYSSGKMQLNYINVPVLAQYMFGNGFRLQTGPQLGILTTSKFKSGNTKVDVDMRTADVAWSFGASYISPMRLGVDARYNLGLTDISKASPDLKNRVWQLGLFYQFRHQ